VDLPDADPTFHTVYDLDERYQVPGMQYTQAHSICEKCPIFPSPNTGGGNGAKRRGIYDDKSRLMVVICQNMDLGRFLGERRRGNLPRKILGAGNPDRGQLPIYGMSH